ncbi:MAG: GGDEF domain-containing protein [Deltaproteobacteria bacterium]|nr:GGDEF domain-containing protein [Deltaproteobacteria bacterium]
MALSPNLLTWSLGVQLGAVVLIALFFAILSRSVHLSEVRLWTLAWFSEVIAVGAGFLTVSGWLPSAVSEGPREIVSTLFLAIFIGGKLLFATFFIVGTRSHFRPGFVGGLGTKSLIAVCLSAGLLLAFLAPTPIFVLPIVWSLVGPLLFLGGWWALHGMEGRARWLGWVLLGEGILFFSYVPQLLPVIWGDPPLTAISDFSSLIDAGADVLLALATLVALESSRSSHLQRLNDDLYASYERVRQLVDNDPLTGLRNRRALRQVLDRAQQTGGSLIFLDIDGFKTINDRQGHAVGDACLIRLAAVLAESFRPEDSLVRWGGDEFLVVAQGMSLKAADERIRAVRAALREVLEGVPPVSLSVGAAFLQPGDEPSEALKLADQKMYSDKRRLAASLRV